MSHAEKKRITIIQFSEINIWITWSLISSNLYHYKIYILGTIILSRDMASCFTNRKRNFLKFITTRRIWVSSQIQENSMLSRKGKHCLHQCHLHLTSSVISILKSSSVEIKPWTDSNVETSFLTVFILQMYKNMMKYDERVTSKET